MPVIYEGGEVFELLVNREAFVFGRGHCLDQLCVFYWTFLEMKSAERRRRMHRSSDPSQACRQSHLPVHGWTSKSLTIVTQRHVRKSFKDLGCGLTNHSGSTCFSIRQTLCFPMFPIQRPGWAIFLLISSSSRGQAGERRRVVYYSKWSRVFWTC